MTSEQAAEAVRYADSAGVPLQIGYHRRFDPDYVRLRDRISAGSLGQSTRRACGSLDAEPPPATYGPTSGDIFVDMHARFDLAPWLLGHSIAEVAAVGANRGPGSGVRRDDFDTSALILTLGNGVPVSVFGARHNWAGYESRVEVAGSLGGHGGEACRRYSRFMDRFQEAYTAEIAAFIEFVLGAAVNPCPGHEAVSALRVAECAAESARVTSTAPQPTFY